MITAKTYSETRLVLASLFLIILTTLAEANETNSQIEMLNALPSNELINQSFLYDNTTVLYRGEVVGPVMFRGEYAWINVYDGVYAIGVWCPAKDARGIRFYGDYNKKGDVVEVSGVFHRACLSHGGDLDIHCSTLRVVEDGSITPHPIGKFEILTAFLLGLIAVVLFFEKGKERYRDTVVAVKSPIWRIFFRIRKEMLSGVLAEIAVPVYLMIIAVVICLVVALVIGIRRMV